MPSKNPQCFGSGGTACAGAAALGLLAAAAPIPVRAADKAFEIYGFAMADYIQDSKRVDPDWQDAFRPSKIGIDGQYGTNGESDLSVKQSRFGVQGRMPTGAPNQPISFKFEFDLFGTGDDAGQTTFRLRHFYGEWQSLLAGQTNSVFMDGDVFPNVIDYWGPAGLVFYRNVQLRWTPYKTPSGQFAIALERPSNDIDPGALRLIDVFADAEVQDKDEVPDLTAHYREDGGWGHFQAAGILRRIGYEYRVSSTDPWRKGNQTGWGVNLSGAIKTGERDQVLLQIVHGNGISSYMNDGGMDIAPNAAFLSNLPVPLLSAEPVPLTGLVAYYDHYWSSLWSTSIGYSFTKVSNTNFQETDAFHQGQYASVDLLAYPTDSVMLGGELLWGRRTNNNGDSGDDMRFQFSVKYSFGIKL